METKTRGHQHRHFLTIVVSNLFLSLTVLFFQPLEVILMNRKEFLIPFGNIWWLQLGIAAACTLLASVLIFALSTRLRIRGLPEGTIGRTASALAFGTGLALWVQSMFLNGGMVSLTGAEMKTSAAGEIINLLVWILLIAGPVIAVILCARKARETTERVICFAAGALIIMQGVAMISLAASTDSGSRQEIDHFLSSEGEFALGDGDNTVVFVLDTTDEDYFDVMMSEYPEMNGVLSGWTYYSNATSVYSRTYPSLTYLLTGEKCYFDVSPSAYVEQAFGRSRFLKNLHQTGVDTRIFTTETAEVGNDAGAYIANSSGYAYTLFSNIDIPRLEKNILKISFFKSMPYVLKPRFAYHAAEINTTSFRKTGEQEPFSHYFDPVFYEAMQDSGLSKTNVYHKAFRFYHLNGVPPGFYWDQELQRTDTPRLGSALRGSFLMIQNYTDRMKELGLYDASTIIVIADHGSSGGNSDKLDVPAAACPLILIKYPYSDGGQPLVYDRSPVSQEDLFATIEKALGAPVTGTGSGKGLQDYQENRDRIRYYYYSALYSDEDGEIALREYAIRGNARDLKNWEATGQWWNIEESINHVSPKRYAGE